MVIENVIGDNTPKATSHMKTQAPNVMKGLNTKVAADSMLNLNMRQPRDLDTAIHAMVRKSA